MFLCPRYFEKPYTEPYDINVLRSLIIIYLQRSPDVPMRSIKPLISPVITKNGNSMIIRIQIFGSLK